MSAHRFIRCLAAAGLLLGLAGQPLHAGGPASALEVRTGLHKDFTRLVVETSQPVPYKFSFPSNDEIVVTVTGAALHAAAKSPRARGIIRDIDIQASPRGSRLIVRTKARADIRRQFTLLPKDGRGARIVIDLAAQAVPGPAPLERPPGKATPPKVLLPAPHTDIVGAAESAPEPAASRRRAAGTRPTASFEVAAAGGLQMLFDAPDGETANTAQEVAEVELSQAGGLSIGDWLMREGGNPNVRAIPPAPAPRETVNPPAPPAYPATPVYRAPAEPAPSAHRPSYQPPAYPARQTYSGYRAPQPVAQPVQQHPAHPGYRNPSQPAQSAPAWAPPAPARGTAQSGQASGQDTPATRYASQKQAVPAERQAARQNFRLYGGLGLGFSSFNYESERNNTILDEHLFVWKLYGGYRLSDLVGLELAYGKVGGVDETLQSGSSAEDQFYAISASGLFYLPLTPALTPFARAGLDLWWESADDSASVVGKEDSGAGIVLGLGADYRFSDRINFRGEWELHVLTDEVYANNFLASVLYKF